MVHRLSQAAQQKLLALEEVKRSWFRVHRLVEESAAQRSGLDVYWQQIRRAATGTSRLLGNLGFVALAEVVKGIDMVIRRPTSAHVKTRGLREMVATVRSGIEDLEAEIVVKDRERALAKERADRARREPPHPHE